MLHHCDMLIYQYVSYLCSYGNVIGITDENTKRENINRQNQGNL